MITLLTSQITFAQESAIEITADDSSAFFVLRTSDSVTITAKPGNWESDAKLFFVICLATEDVPAFSRSGILIDSFELDIPGLGIGPSWDRGRGNCILRELSRTYEEVVIDISIIGNENQPVLAFVASSGSDCVTDTGVDISNCHSIAYSSPGNSEQLISFSEFSPSYVVACVADEEYALRGVRFNSRELDIRNLYRGSLTSSGGGNCILRESRETSTGFDLHIFNEDEDTRTIILAAIE